MTRQQRQSNPLGVALTVGTTIALCAAILLYRHPELILWLVALFAACITGGAALVAAEARAEASGLRDQLRAEREAHEAERADVVRVPVLRVVPTQRTGEHDDAGREWPRLAREIESETPIHDGLAVEEFMDAVEAWGNDADGAS